MEISHVPPAPAHAQPPLLSMSLTRWYIFTKGEPTRIHHYHSKSTVYCGFTLGVVYLMGLDKCIKTCIHHCKIIQSSFTALKILCAAPIHPSFPPTPGNHSSFLLQLYLFQNVIELESYSLQPFQIGFFHLGICTYRSSMSLSWLTAHFFWALNNIPSSGGTTVYLSFHLLMDILAASTFW